ncbi:hypothetical protein D9M08_02625 [Escherichia albertii]|nr:hypothetical protein [Escherichia albertii]EEW3327279.1 hypothetical protein [Escherichia albertii]EEW4356590.1 hypothetical protein [Escherichia albertii]EEW6708589.1 hypothetical protein [Escherichia albertii]EEW7339110.1 hypothetical protein [Escherichia albertii]
MTRSFSCDCGFCSIRRYPHLFHEVGVGRLTGCHSDVNAEIQRLFIANDNYEGVLISLPLPLSAAVGGFPSAIRHLSR